METYDHCAYCQRRYLKNPRVKLQSYCGADNCQRARKRRWQRHKMATDPDYRLNQKDCMLRWRQRHPNYWREYRGAHPTYAAQNRILQKLRNLNRPAPTKIAKMGPFPEKLAVIPGIYYIIKKCSQIAYMDALLQKILILPAISQASC